MLFFLSYARTATPDGDVLRFFADLSAEVRLFTGEAEDAEVGFVDIGRGASWSEPAVEALSTCAVFVALCSPEYFRQPVCGKEWGVFAARLGAYQRAYHQPAPALLPVLWAPTSFPPVGLGPYTDLQFGPAYPKIGLRAVARSQADRDDYLETVTALAQRIVSTASSYPMPESIPRPQFDEAFEVFAVWSPPAATDDAAARASEARAIVLEAFAAASRPIQPTEVAELLVPGPVWVCTASQPDPGELTRFQDELSVGRTGYFVHAEDLDRPLEEFLDRLRMSGRAVVSVPLRELHAALEDGRAGFFLSELDRGSGSRVNLFDHKTALTEGRFLFGRDAILNTVGTVVDRGEHVLITGLRKVGKTSVLNVLRQHLVGLPVCKVDLQQFNRRSPDEYWPGVLFRLMVQAFDRWGGAGGQRWPFVTIAPATGSDLKRELDLRFAHPDSPARLVVMLDEVEIVFPRRDEPVAAGRWVDAMGALRALSQDDRRVVVVGAGLRPDAVYANELGDARLNPFFGLFQELPLPLLDRPALADMVYTLAGEMGVDTTAPSFVEGLFEMTGGHPFLARTIAAEAYRTRYHPSRLGAADLHQAAERLEQDYTIGRFLEGNIWQLMTFPERQLMRGAPVHSGERGAAEARLRAQGLLDGGRPRIGLLERWIRNTQPLDR
ncbi:TIR-like protein FxsC [Phytohabitans houttuyneae]|uniref:TIR domain-containing protein n=1 Tax=Phytohabitans houttuyneae TaxID=1076126 RepID=A0A6V8JXD4_9ACTN|nr:TIR-like protein FxsC [Phytohabitans houttuyneae]GFJ77372.1 hypothetical protein Phou_015520 [Phytohabitans houttuyneae]